MQDYIHPDYQTQPTFDDLLCLVKMPKNYLGVLWPRK